MEFASYISRAEIELVCERIVTRVLPLCVKHPQGLAKSAQPARHVVKSLQGS